MVDRRADDFLDEVASWSQLSDLVEHFSYFNGHDWLFRGVTDAAHGLVPRIGREDTRGLKHEQGTTERVRVPYREEDERAVFTMFRQQARPHLPSQPESEIEWLAIAQHFGLPTRFLDWTDILLAAAWFAVEDGGAKKNDSALWVTKGVPPVDNGAVDPLKIAEPGIYRPPHMSPRIAAQGSVLMICPKPTEELDLTFAKKIVIRHEAQFIIKKRLNACGINRRQLFPDLIGLIEHLTWLHKNDWLAGYRPGRASQVTSVTGEAQDDVTE
mgnify:CR=1 FL=1